MRDKFNKQLNTTLGQLSKAYELRSFTRNDIKEVQKKERRVCNSISDCDDINIVSGSCLFNLFPCKKDPVDQG